jgi:hypothetical protein
MTKFDSSEMIISEYDKLLPIMKILRIISNKNTNINNVTLTEAQINNLNKICNCLFNGDFIGNEDKFVFFKFFDYYPSIMNRLWIEKQDICFCIYPKKKLSEFDAYKNNYLIFQGEISKIKSCINQDKHIMFKEIDVLDSNPNEPEGGPHCLFKQRFINIR